MTSQNETTSLSPTESIEELCSYPPAPMLEVRFWLVSVFGSTVSVISIVENIFLFLLFATRKRHRKENVYMMLLAFFDIFVSIAYVMLMSVNILADYLESPVLIQIWFSYMVPMITISHIAMSSSSFLIVAASFERYCLTLNSRFLRTAQKQRLLIALSAVFLGILSKGTMCLEFQVVDQPECAGTMMAKKLFFRPFVFNTPYHLVFRYWYRNFVTVFAPFFILSYLNFRIVKAFTHLPKMSIVDLSACDMARRKANARAATRTLVLVACCYLVSNIINVVVTTFEHTNKEHLTENYPRLYMLAIDLVSLLTTMACACRLPIYMSCQKALRQEVLQVFRRIIPGRNSYLEEQTQETMLPMSKSFESETPTPLASPAPDPTAASEEEEEDRIYWMSPPPKSVGSPYETLL